MSVASRADDFQKLLLHVDSENLHLPGSLEPLKANNKICVSPFQEILRFVPKESLSLPEAKEHSSE